MKGLPLTAVLLLSCSTPPIRPDAERLRALARTHHQRYLQVLELDNRLASETTDWLNGPLANLSRASASSESNRMSGQWAAVHVGYKWIAQEIGAGQFDSAPVREVHRRIVGHLKDRQQRGLALEHLAYVGYRTGFGNAPVGSVPKEIDQIKQILTSHPRATDEITLLLKQLPE